MSENARMSQETTATPQARTLKLFLEQAGPSALEQVDATSELVEPRISSEAYRLTWPELLLFCESPECGGDRFFDPRDATIVLGDSSLAHKLLFVTYTCRHCKKRRKTYAVTIWAEFRPEKTNVKFKIMKFGEDPPAIGPTPRALKDMLGEHWSLYLQGRRSELAGLGIGAFVYYRRAVERIWHTALTRLIEVARLDPTTDRVQALEAAQKEERFTRSMELAKAAIPISLYINGHNPFQSLYDACGDGLHEYSDEDCLNRSKMIRLVLSKFSERAKSVLSDDAEFQTAVGRLASKAGP